MTLTLADIERWDPGAVREVFHAATSRAQAAADAANGLATLPAFTSWGGVAAEAAREAIGTTRRDLDAHGREALAVASAARTAADEIEHLKSELASVKADAESLGMEIDPVTGRVLPGRFVRDPMEALLKEEQLQPRVDTIIAEANMVDIALANAIHMADGTVPIPTSGSTTPTPENPKDPAAVKRWWDSLTPEQRDQIIKDHPEQIGNLNGIPTEVQHAANAAVQQHDLDRVNAVAQSHHVSPDEVQVQPENYGLTGTDMTRYHNAVQVQKAIDRYAGATDAGGGHPQIYLKKYDPEAFGGKGAASISIGNPDKAGNTAVKVSGLSTSVAHGSLDNADPVNLYHEMSMADPSKSNAVLMWMGYDAPDDQAVAVPNMARHGAQLLSADVNALGVRHEGAPSHLTVVGHSYGSTTVADAAAGYGMRADDVVLIGSPGTDLAHSAADFHLPAGGHLYVGAASTDPVTHLGAEHGSVIGTGLGADPAIDGYGSTRFHAEAATWDLNPFADHSKYFERGSESLFSMADVASGHGVALAQDGMTAGHRSDVSVVSLPVAPGVSLTVPTLDQVTDPESWHVAHNDHYHA